MKQDRTSGKFLTVCSVALLVTLNGLAQDATTGAKVIRLKGFARFTTGGYAFQPVHVGQILRPGTVIQTSADEGSYVDLAFGDDKAIELRPTAYRPGIVSSMSPTPPVRRTSEPNVVRVWGDSALGIDKVAAAQTGADLVTETQLDLKRGRMTGNVKKLSAGSKYEVKLPNGVAGVRGTLFDIQAAGIIKVYVGSIVVAWVDPKTQAVTTQTILGGQTFDAPDKELSAISPELLSQVDQLSADLTVPQLQPTAVTVAPDKTVIGMSPVGAAPGTVGTANPAPGQEGTGAASNGSGHP